jgi:GMC oxidoreductase/FAD dependent oxidoreductase
MLIDLRHAAEQGPASAEILIVGSGAVGLTMALALARAGRQVILLEAGSRSVEAESQDFFKTAQWRDRHLPGLHLGRFRALGGTTNFWGGRLIEFEPIIFERRPWVAEIGWPISREELLPYYERGYELLGMTHPLEAEAIWKRLNIAPPSFDNELEVFFSAWTPEANFAALFAREIAATRELSVFVNAPVVALEMAEAGDRVASVVVRTPSGAVRRFSAPHIVLASGTIELVRLLKLPLSDGRPAPWHGNQWLGRGFTEHIDCFGGQVMPLHRKRFHDLFDNAYIDGVKYMPMLRLSDELQREGRLFNIGAQFIFNSRIREHVGNAKALVRSLLRGRFERSYLPDLQAGLSVLRVAVPMVVRYLRYRRMYNPVDQGIHLRLICEQSPVAESAIYLSEKRDSLGMPTVEIDWRIDGRELETIARTGELVARHLERHRLASVQLDPGLVARDAGVLARALDSYHHMGMARMARNASEGVVDRDLRVFGMRNLYVAGAAVFPTTGFANPTFTAIALGLRLADAVTSVRTSSIAERAAI